jgi:ribosomal protein L32|uniref:Large ribosomal subunit protein bL32c n=2 Tax=Trifolium TaxID=3898 RepID=A0A0K0LVA9_TRICP|nr:ribosomal protein L32 [Trifolium boissieri]AIJ27867.1 ribosomal protein L32 [Trifolium boissieri]AJE72214.1 ribosomal protein L32 [Trifolium campestre]
MAVPKKRTSISKKKIRKNFWKKGGYWTALKALSLAESILTGKSKSFVCNKKDMLEPRGFLSRSIL